MIGEMPMHQGRELPRFRVRQIDLPNITEWGVNSTHYIILKVEMVGKQNRKDLEAPEDKQKIEADFEILSIRPLEDKSIDAKSLEREDFEGLVAKAKSGLL